MKKVYRLLKNEDFQRVIQTKKSVASKNFILYYEDNQLHHIRIGITLNSRYGGAVVRNKAKRQVRSMVQQHFETTTGKDIVIIIRNGFKTKDYEANTSDLLSLWSRVKKGEKKYETT